MVFNNISGINITLPPKVLAPDDQLNLPVNTTIITDCVCINCTHVPSYYNSSIIVKWSSGYRLPNSWVFLRNDKRYQALSPHYRGVCGVGRILPALHPGYKRKMLLRALPSDCDENLKL